MKQLFWVFIFLSLCNTLFAQKDKQFWFAAPYISKQHGNLPINLQIATFDEAAYVEISIPANKNFKPIKRHIPASTPIQLKLDIILKDIINENYNSIADKGILITSSTYISISYEVLGYDEFLNQIVNSDIFALKGNNALGKRFYTPYQTSRENENKNLTDAYSAFHIVATENNTQVTITPTKALYGHPAGVPFTITLQKGQTYSCRALGRAGIEHPAGTEIISTHPIAVTVTDDSVLEKDSYDLLGDQIVPVEQLGLEYIIPKMDSSSINYIYVLATENDTQVIINQSDTLKINRGQTIEYELKNHGTYVQSNQPVYVWHLSSMFNEIAAAIIPQIGCSGSKSTIFTRKSLESFGLVIVAKSNSIDHFKLNGNGSLVMASDFKEVDGNTDYKVYFKLFTLEEVKLNKVYSLTNSVSDFQMGIISADNWTSFRYGYFSNFSHINLGPDQKYCTGSSTILNAGPDNDSYLWNTGEVTQEIQVTQSAEYSVIIQKGICTSYDTIKVDFHDLPIIDLGPDIKVCKNEMVTLYGPEHALQYIWSTNANSQNISPTESGVYSLEITDTNYCKNSDIISLEYYSLPEPDIRFENTDKALCDYPSMTISTEESYTKIVWSNGDTTNKTVVPVNSTYSLEVTDINQCKGKVEKTLDCSPYITIFNLCTPNNDGKNDLFIIDGMHNQKYHLEVYNRWGNKVHYQKNYNNDWSPIDLPNGIYYYVLSHSEKDLIFKEWLQIIK
jgi:gliding motility-associated-like protein